MITGALTKYQSTADPEKSPAPFWLLHLSLLWLLFLAHRTCQCPAHRRSSVLSNMRISSVWFVLLTGAAHGTELRLALQCAVQLTSGSRQRLRQSELEALDAPIALLALLRSNAASIQVCNL